VNKRIVVSTLCVCGLAVLGATPKAALEEDEQGVYQIDAMAIDELLTIGSRSDVSVLVLEDKETKSISDAHMKVLRGWVEAGGVLWVAGDGLESSLAQTVAPFRWNAFDFVRSSSGNRGGELIVKGLSPRMTISDHVLTEGVSQLYLFAQSKFDGTAGAEPLVQMGDSAGNSGWVLAAVPVGRGFLVLDGTARKGRWIFRRLNGFNDDHPNSLKQDSGWNDYDWDRMLVNARDHAQQELAWRLP
jgi:hypothetical protein